ncbi:hypothetical protein L208DRAFT_1397145 [Tricholoma matsutake]|nr:hypothetical protein L208DRAFT_1397145 [Tricholoma matsutake 945]
MRSNSMFRFALLAIVSTFIISANAAPVPGNSLQFNSVSDIVEREVKKSISLLMKRGNAFFRKPTTDEESQPLTSPEDDEPEGSNKRVKKKTPKGNKLLKKPDSNSYSKLPER